MATRATFRPRHRLTHARQYQSVYAARVSRTAGPLVIFAAPNGLPEPRLGLSVGTRVGNAVRRNRVKRLIREAFRALRHDLPWHEPPATEDGAGAERCRYDHVVNVRPHDAAELADYVRWFSQAAATTHAAWGRRGPRPDSAKPKGTRP